MNLGRTSDTIMKSTAGRDLETKVVYGPCEVHRVESVVEFSIQTPKNAGIDERSILQYLYNKLRNPIVCLSVRDSEQGAAEGGPEAS